MSTTSGTNRQIDKALVRGLRSLEKPLPLRLSEWAERHFYLSPESSYIQGRWENLPYQIGIMDCISNDDIRSVTVMKSARVGFSKMVVAAIGYFAEHKQRNQVVFLPVDQDAEDFTKDEIDPMLRDCVSVQRVFPYYATKSKYNTLSKKVFIGSTLDIRGGKAGKNYRRISKDVVYYDELSGFDHDIQNEGDPITLGDKRIEGATFPKSVRGSTPKKKGPPEDGGCLIEAEYERADERFRFHVKCPHCGHEQSLRWGGKAEPMGFKWVNNDPATVRYLCENTKSCGALFSYGDYLKARDRGRWISETGIWIDRDGVFQSSQNKPVDAPLHVAFHLWTGVAGLVAWSLLVREFIAASKDRSKLKTFVNTTLGETWEDDESERANDELLYARREHYPAEIPAGGLYLVAGIDTQDDRVEVQIDAYGLGEERWSIDYIRLLGDPGRQTIWNKLAELLGRTYRREDDTMLGILLSCQDKGGHYTDEVNRFSKRMGIRKLIPIHGSKYRHRPVAMMPRKRDKAGCYGTEVGTDTAKTLLYQRYKILEPGPGYVHWPIKGPQPNSDPFDREYFAQVTAEEQVKRYRAGVAELVWDAKKRRNEATDCSVYSLAAIRILQQHFGINLATNSQRLQVPEHQPSTGGPGQKSRWVKPHNSWMKR
jgi:phage terminase large subunit GpA-like protein